MEINFNIKEKAEKIMKQKEELRSYINKCLWAELCPQCGEEIVSFVPGLWGPHPALRFRYPGEGPPIPRFKCSRCKWVGDFEPFNF